MKTANKWVLATLVVVVAAGMAMVGCESTQTTDNVITISPSSVILTNDFETLTFTASMTSTNTSLTLPLVWSVSDPGRGTIRASGGVTAIYESKNLAGNNTVTVRDQGDNSGIAVVIH